MEVSAIVAVSENGVIGCEGRIPWHIPNDLKHFKQITQGGAIIMGRVTWESLPVRPLPGRQNIVVTRTPGYEAPGANVVSSIENALKISTREKIYIIGGAQIYEAAVKYTRRIYLTRIHKQVEGDTFFHVPHGFILTETEPHEDYTFEVYQKKYDR